MTKKNKTGKKAPPPPDTNIARLKRLLVYVVFVLMLIPGKCLRRLEHRKRRKPVAIKSCFLYGNGKDLDQKMSYTNNYSINNWNAPLVCTSQLCNQEFFGLPLYQYWVNMIKEEPILYRKQWEFVYIIQTLYENGMLLPGKKGLGFGCGTEPLPALFASCGCEILATDLDLTEANAKKWVDSNQNTMNKAENLNNRAICPSAQFRELVKFQPINMNDIPKELYGQFDFNWSACAVEHIGGMEKSISFLIDNLKTLKSGGVAVHTSEFNLSSDTDTCLHPDCFIFRKQDVEKTAAALRSLGHEVFPLNFKVGTYIADNFIDYPPYLKNAAHLRLELSGFVSTSFGLIVRKR
jgi:2-polyprenyl-3-methyl-5-hydroxy-6-metoxy-1,4-benzoquinol methylase